MSLKQYKRTALNPRNVREPHGETLGQTRVWSATLPAVGSSLPENHAYFNRSQKKHCSNISAVVVTAHIFIPEWLKGHKRSKHRKVFWSRPWFSLCAQTDLQTTWIKVLFMLNKDSAGVDPTPCFGSDFWSCVFPFHSRIVIVLLYNCGLSLSRFSLKLNSQLFVKTKLFIQCNRSAAERRQLSKVIMELVERAYTQFRKKIGGLFCESLLSALSLLESVHE